MIFDVREDIKELSIPYFKRKRLFKKKCRIQEIIELKKELQDVHKVIGIGKNPERNGNTHAQLEETMGEKMLREITALKETL